MYARRGAEERAGYMLRPMAEARLTGHDLGMNETVRQLNPTAPAHEGRTRLRSAADRRTDRRPSSGIDAALDLLERDRLAAGELRILLALVDRDATISDVAKWLRRKPRDVRLAAARLYARGLLRWRFRRSKDRPLEKEEVLGITGDGLGTIRPLLTQ